MAQCRICDDQIPDGQEEEHKLQAHVLEVITSRLSILRVAGEGIEFKFGRALDEMATALKHQPFQLHHREVPRTVRMGDVPILSFWVIVQPLS